MLLRTIADKQGELVFTPQCPAALQHVQVPGADCYSTSGPFGHLLYQQISMPYCTIWLRHYLLQRYATFTCISAQPAITLVLQLTNSLQYTSAALGMQEFHERAYNLCFVPSVHDKLLFRKEGLYSRLEIHMDAGQLQQLVTVYPKLNPFIENIQQQQAGLLMRAHQVSTPQILHIVEQLLSGKFSGENTEIYRLSKCEELLSACLKNMTENPRLKPARIPLKEIDALYAARSILTAHIQQPGFPLHLAGQVNLSDYKLKNGFLQLYNSSPAEFLHQLRMERAMRLLYEDRCNIYDVAEQTGYTNVKSFITAFKRYYHVSPVIYTKPLSAKGMNGFISVPVLPEGFSSRKET